MTLAAAIFGLVLFIGTIPALVRSRPNPPPVEVVIRADVSKFVASMTEASNRARQTLLAFGLTMEQTANSIDRWIVAIHSAKELPDGRAVCASCWLGPAFPCTHRVAAAERISNRAARRAGPTSSVTSQLV